MAITQAMCTSFKKELLEGVHNFKNSGGNTFKLALYAISSGGKSSTTATLGATTTAFTDFDDISFTTATITARGALIYNDSASGNPAVCALDFGGNKTSTSGTFTIQFPTANASNAIIRIA